MLSDWKHYPTQHPHSVTGDLRWIRHFSLPQLHARRPVSVWLPPGYQSSTRRYPVIYMFDGQNLFDRERAFGHSEWHVDETMAHLAGEGMEAIVVAMDHGGERRVREYTPFGAGQGEATLDALEQQIKPRIDGEFRTQAGAEGAFVAGSSMGGLMSLYAVLKRPHLFGGAAVFSPALWPERRAIFGLVEQATPPPVRIYIDHGTGEPSARPMAALLHARGYTAGGALLYVAERGARHTESAWARRFPDAVRFLLAGRFPAHHATRGLG
jgi:predicted alpha/beta superfamily hydrolase